MTAITTLIAEYLMGPIGEIGEEDDFDEEVHGPGVIAMTRFSWCHRQGSLIFGLRQIRVRTSQYLTHLN